MDAATLNKCRQFFELPADERVHVGTESPHLLSRKALYRYHLALSTVQSVERKNTAMVIPDALEVTLLDGTKYFFNNLSDREAMFETLRLALDNLDEGEVASAREQERFRQTEQKRDLAYARFPSYFRDGQEMVGDFRGKCAHNGTASVPGSIYVTKDAVMFYSKDILDYETSIALKIADVCVVGSVVGLDFGGKAVMAHTLDNEKYYFGDVDGQQEFLDLLISLYVPKEPPRLTETKSRVNERVASPSSSPHTDRPSSSRRETPAPPREPSATTGHESKKAHPAVASAGDEPIPPSEDGVPPSLPKKPIRPDTTIRRRRNPTPPALADQRVEPVLSPAPAPYDKRVVYIGVALAVTLLVALRVLRDLGY